jgi:15-cis-phytoene synthase
MLDLAWDEHLLSRATTELVEEKTIELPDQFAESLHQAYRYCNTLTAIHSKSFYMASCLLDAEKRKAIRALYAFCRTTDDIIDLEGKDKEKSLQLWREHGLSAYPRANDPVSIAWADTRLNFKIPKSYAYQLIDGVYMDTHKVRYENFTELSEYCYGVASTVGLMSMHIIGFTNESAIRYAVKLGVALQLTNILRDIAEDYTLGRVYLPQDELKRFGISERHLREGIIDDNWIAFMKFQITRTRSIYDEAWPGIKLLHPSGQLSIAAAATFYKGILGKIEENNFDVFNGRACLGKWSKVKMIPGLWFTYSLLSKGGFNALSNRKK